MLCNANLQDRAVFTMWSLKVSWSSNITPRFLTELDGVIVDESIWMVKSCCRVGAVVIQELKVMCDQKIIRINICIRI